MSGYPGVDLVGDGGAIRLPVARAAHRVSTVILKRGQHASFALTYLLETLQEANAELGAWGPFTAVITAPGSVSHQTLAWRLGFVQRFSIETGRGTFLTPVGR